MKHLLFFFFAVSALCCHAKVYTKKVYYDKFDDIIKEETIKSLITKTDSTLTIEEKGRKPIVYYILNIVDKATVGSKEEVVNLVADVYGYQTCWCLVRYDKLDEFREALQKYVQDSSEENSQAMSSFWIFATHRIITTQYTGRYEDEYFWLEDEMSEGKLGKGINRIIYK